MRVSAQLLWSSVGVYEAVRQTVSAFGDVFASVCAEQSGFSQIAELSIGLSAMHPMMRAEAVRPSGRYHAATGVFYAAAPVDYFAWVGDSWLDRADAVAAGLTAAIAKIHGTRVSAEERRALLAAIEHSRALAAAAPPAKLDPLEPVRIVFDAAGQRFSVGGLSGVDHAGIGFSSLILRPADVRDYLRDHPHPPPPLPPPFKLYRRAEGRLEYQEAWAEAGNGIVVHWGVCGDRGKAVRRAAGSPNEQRLVLNSVKSHARAEGYRSMPISRHGRLLVSAPIDGFGSAADLDERHALETFLDSLTGMLGLGHCDGGSIGSGSMEAFCFVVDYDIAAEAIRRALVDSPFRRFVISKG